MSPVPSVPALSPFRTFFSRHKLHLVLIFITTVLFAVFTALLSERLVLHPSVTLGWILSMTNAFLGYVFIERAFRYNSNVFLFIAFSGMALRFFVMIAAVALTLLTGIVETASFIASFMAFYVTGMAIEILHINRKIDDQRLAKVLVKRR